MVGGYAVSAHGMGTRPSGDVDLFTSWQHRHEFPELATAAFLVVGARCRWAESGPELNALAIDGNGQIHRRGCLGDGIQHLQVAGDGTIWAGYFDEGVFGNMGWGGPGPAPLGAGGVAAWSPDFEKAWELNPRKDSLPTATRSTSGLPRSWRARTQTFPSSGSRTGR